MRTEKAQRKDREASERTSSILRPPTHPAILQFVFLGILVALLAGVSTASAQGRAPDTPDEPTGTAVFIGGADLEWNDVSGADSYEVQLFTNGEWTLLPANGVEIAFYGAGGIVSGLDPGATLWFRVRARNAHGSSNWSAYGQMASTSQSQQGRQPRAENVSANGAPVISGTAQVGETLTVDTSGIEDPNGLARVQFRFQWVSSNGGADTVITNATDSSYTVLAADEDNAIKVRVDFTDRGGYSESLTSAATASVTTAVEGSGGGETPQNSPATGAPTISGTSLVGETLTADTSGIADGDGLTNVSYSYQWIANDGNSDSNITGATGSSYTLVAADEGKTIKVRVDFTDDGGNAETLTSAATGEVAARPTTPARPTVASVSHEAVTITWADPGDSSIAGYQVLRRNPAIHDSDVFDVIEDDTGSSDTSYTDTTVSPETTYRYRVKARNAHGLSEWSKPAARFTTPADPTPPNAAPTGLPTITGTPQVGETLTADTSGIADGDGLTNVSYSYQWIANDGNSDSDIADATGSSYTLVAADEGKTIKVRVDFTDDAGNAETLTSASTSSVAARPNNEATGAPTISGTAQVGETLTADTSGIADGDGLTNVSYSYQWIANDGNSDANITDATGSSYTLVAADEGKTIKVRVDFTDDSGNAETLTSAATGAIQDDDPPEGSTRNADLSALTVDGVSVAGFSASITEYQFGVDASVAQVTVSGDADEAAAVAYSGTDADSITNGHQVDLSEGRNVVTVTVTAADNNTIKKYSVSINQGSEAPYGWSAGDDFDTLAAAGNKSADGLWSDGTTMWVSDDTNDHERVFAYTLATKQRDPSKDIHVREYGAPSTLGNTHVREIWSDGTTMWVVNQYLAKLFAYTLAGGQRDPAKDIYTDSTAGNKAPRGLWSDGTTMWVSDAFSKKIFAYTLATKQRDPGKDIDTRGATNRPAGLWSDGTTMWVAVSFDSKLYAYTLVTKQRDPDRDFDVLAGYGNTLPWAIWSDGTTMWMSDYSNAKLFAYNMPGNADLSALSLSAGTLTPAFGTATTSYTVPVGNSVSQVTVTAEEADAGNATVVFLDDNDAEIPDADDNADGQQVDLALGDNTIKVKVTASDLVTTRVYTLTVHRAVPVSVSFGAPTYTAGEGNSTTVTISLDQAPGREVVIPLTVVDGSGVTSADYSGVPSMVTFAASAASASFDFDAGDDNVVEGDESVTVKFGLLPDGVAADPGAAAVVTIVDDDAVSWAVSVGSASIAEEGETSTAVTVSTGGVTFTEAKTVTLVLAGAATEVADYTVTAKTLTLAAGEAWVAATVTAVDDAAIDIGESIEVTAMLDGAAIGVQQTITIADNDGANTAPVFSPQSVTRQVAENAAPGTAVGSPVTATDADLHTLNYTLGGVDAASFTIVAASGQIQTKTGVVYDYEAASNTYSVTVTADDDNGGTATAAVVINLADENEPPEAPATPAVSAVSGSSTSLDVSWTAPDTTQKPDIIGYGVEYRKTGDTNWTAWSPPTLATATTISGLAARTEYEVQVNATNDEGTSGWSTPGTGSTVAACSPVFDPAPTSVEVTAVPIVVQSNTDEYFVLYVNHQESGRVVETPVAVIRGEASTTTLAENVTALPADRYRVEKYLIADPADVDGDCVDDLTELDDLGAKSPVNPAPAIDLVNGAAAVPDQNTFETLSYNGQYVKFVLLGMDTDSPILFFINSKTHLRHPIAFFLDAIDLLESDLPWAVPGEIVYDPELLAPDGSTGVYYWWLNRYDNRYSADLLGRIHTLLAAGMPLLEDNLALHIPNFRLASYQSELPQLRQSRIPLMFDEDIYPGSSFLPMNPAVGYGWLRVIEQGERPHPRDIAIYEALPNELPRVAGIITTVPQTPLSHVNLRAVQDAVPNAFIGDALGIDTIDGLLDSYVRYEVTESGWSLRAASPEEVDAHYAALRPAEAQVLQRDMSVTSITPLSDIGFEDWDAFGVKAANVAELAKLGFADGTVPDGFAIPFHFYDRFMNEAVLGEESVFGRGSAPNEEKITLPAGTTLSEVVTEILAHPEFQADFDIQDEMLDDLRDAIEDAETPQWIIDAIVAMNTEFDSKFPGGQNRRYRSSTNNEDLPGFNGAGLYDSKSQKASEDEEDLAKSLKEVYASLWNLRAFVERDFHRIDHQSAAMGILVHPSYQNELANGVAVSFDPIRGYDGYYYLNTQLGEDLVTNPEAYSEPEEILLHPSGNQYEILATSNQVEPGELLLDDAQLLQLGGHLEVIHDHFKALYDPAPGEPFAIEIEFKITSSGILAIKQARPWVFSNQTATGLPTIAGTPQVGETLTAVTSGIADANGLTNVQYTYQWIRNGGTADTQILGATGATYTLAPADEDNTIKVSVSFTDDDGYSETLTSAATAAVVATSVEQLWSGDMTVVDYGSGSLGAYKDDTLFSNVTSSLQLEIDWLWYYGPERKLYLAFDAPIADTGDWILQIGDLALEFPSGDSSFTFRNVDVSWTVGQVVNVSIVR